MNNRIDYLDGLRGLAIIFVLGFHAFFRWTEIVPYKDQYADFLVFKYGWLGVELFFLISGFVIMMTLEKSRSVTHFLYKRWLRLFPAMLIVSLLVYFSASFFYERPAGTPQLLDLLPGLTFIEPYWWSALLNREINSLEGAYWSLYVEVQFYVIAAIIYFWRGKLAVIVAMYVFYLAAMVLALLPELHEITLFNYLHKISIYLSFKYFGWFGAGASYYMYYTTNQIRWYWVGVIGSLFCALCLGISNVSVGIAATVITSIFALSLISTTLQKILRAKLLLLVGACSYPLYLIHENIMISSIVKLDGLGWNLPGFVYPLIVCAMLFMVATVISEKLEPRVKSFFQWPKKQEQGIK